MVKILEEEIIEVEVVKTSKQQREEKAESIKRKALLVKDITVESARVTLENPKTYAYAAGFGVFQGLKRNFKQGGIAGLAVAAGMVGYNVVKNIINNIEEIKKA